MANVHVTDLHFNSTQIFCVVSGCTFPRLHITNKIESESHKRMTVVMAIAVSAAVGILFGFVPARRAARLNPIDALRYE